MAELKNTSLEREYIIPLRNEWLKVEYYNRTGKAIKTIKKFIAKHMKVPDRDVSKVKLDVYLNQEIFWRGRKKPPAKIKVRAKKEGDFVKVELAELPPTLKFLKAKHEKRHKKSEIKAEKTLKEEPKKEENPAQTEEKKKAESEKEKAVAEQRALEAKLDAKAEKHTTQVKEAQVRQKTSKGFSR